MRAQLTAYRHAEHPPPPHGQTGGRLRVLQGGPAGNARLTALSGSLIFVLLAAEGITILGIRTLFAAHAFIGFLLIPPIGLKLASTGYRFIAYYTGNVRYREAGPPHPFPRVVAPFLVASTIVLFASGVILLILGPGRADAWRQLHTASFFLWFWLMAAHVLTYLLRALSLVHADIADNRLAAVSGAVDRSAVNVGVLILGIVLAGVFLPWDASWTHWLSTFHPDR